MTDRLLTCVAKGCVERRWRDRRCRFHSQAFRAARGRKARGRRVACVYRKVAAKGYIHCRRPRHPLDLVELLQEDARRNGRTVAQTVRFRLRQAFEHADNDQP